MDYKQKAIAHARLVLPEIGKCLNCGNILNKKTGTDGCYCHPKGAIGHPLHLEHWLRVIEDTEISDEHLKKQGLLYKSDIVEIMVHHHTYDLTKNGMSQDEEFYKFICEVCNLT